MFSNNFKLPLRPTKSHLWITDKTPIQANNYHQNFPKSSFFSQTKICYFPPPAGCLRQEGHYFENFFLKTESLALYVMSWRLGAKCKAPVKLRRTRSKHGRSQDDAASQTHEVGVRVKDYKKIRHEWYIYLKPGVRKLAGILRRMASSKLPLFCQKRRNRPTSQDYEKLGSWRFLIFINYD